MASIIPYGNYDRALRRSFPFDVFDDMFTSPLANVVSDAAFKMNVEDTGDAYVVTAELAGVSRDEIDVELNEGRLSISIDKQESEESKSKNFLLKESRSCQRPQAGRQGQRDQGLHRLVLHAKSWQGPRAAGPFSMRRRWDGWGRNCFVPPYRPSNALSAPTLRTLRNT